MKRLLFVQVFTFFCFFSVKAQQWFLGKSQQNIMDSLYKTNYRKFDGQIADGDRYIINFSYDEFQDPAFLKKLDSSEYGILPTPKDKPVYSFVFYHLSCISSKIYYTNLNNYKKTIADLDIHYQNKSKDKVWVDTSGQIEVVVTKHKSTPDFDVEFHKINN